MDAAGLHAGDRVLDVGCGTGALTLAAWQRVGPSGHVTGLDISDSMLTAARGRLRDCGENVRLVHADAVSHPPPPRSLEAVISRFGVGHLSDTARAFDHFRRGLRPSGRVAFVEWATSHVNEWMTLVGEVALRVLDRADLSRTPEHDRVFADEDQLRGALTASGLGNISVAAVTEELWVGESVQDVMDWFGLLPDSRFLREVDAKQRRRFLGELAAELDRRTSPTGVHLAGTAWVVSAVAPDNV
jgi:SAM-dependent methyltransferase